MSDPAKRYVHCGTSPGLDAAVSNSSHLALPQNLRDIFDNPPDIYDEYRIGESDFGDAVAGAALHVVVMDEFDAIARSRGGRSGKGDQGDAGVARDSVVNQLLAKMDGVHPLPVPTLVIGMTNKRSLIEPGKSSSWDQSNLMSQICTQLKLV